MKKLLIALATLPLTQGVASAQNAPTGDAAAGKALWANELRCKDCHGGAPQCAFCPDLAVRGRHFAQAKEAARKPWWIMPRVIHEQVSTHERPSLAPNF